MPRIKTSPESIFLLYGKRGGKLYSIKPAKDIEALCSYYDKNVATEVCYCICPKTMISQKLTLITIK